MFSWWGSRSRRKHNSMDAAAVSGSQTHNLNWTGYKFKLLQVKAIKIVNYYWVNGHWYRRSLLRYSKAFCILELAVLICWRCASLPFPLISCRLLVVFHQYVGVVVTIGNEQHVPVQTIKFKLKIYFVCRIINWREWGTRKTNLRWFLHENSINYTILVGVRASNAPFSLHSNIFSDVF